MDSEGTDGSPDCSIACTICTREVGAGCHEAPHEGVGRVVLCAQYDGAARNRGAFVKRPGARGDRGDDRRRDVGVCRCPQ